jgi:hypothetical protein
LIFCFVIVILIILYENSKAKLIAANLSRGTRFQKGKANGELFMINSIVANLKVLQKMLDELDVSFESM